MPLYRGTAKRALIIPNRAPPPAIDGIGADLALWFDRNEGYKSSGGGIVSATSLLTVARASTAYCFDSSGVMQLAASNALRLDHDPFTRVPLGILNEESRTNLLTWSEEFDRGGGLPWNYSGVTVSADAIAAPNGAMTADKVVEVAAANTPRLVRSTATVSSGGLHTFSIFAKAAERTQIRMVLEGSGNFAAYFNLATGTVGVVGASCTAKIIQCDNGWYRCSITWTTVATNANPYVATAEAGSTVASGDNTKGVYLWGAQLEPGDFLTSYIPTAGSQVSRAADLISMATSGFTFNALAGTMKLDARIYALPTPSIFAPMWHLRNAADGAVTKKLEQYVRHTLGSTRLFIRDASTGQVDQGDAYGNVLMPGVPFKSAVAWELDNFGVSVNGAPVGTDVVGTVPSGLDTLYLGSGGPGGSGIAPVHIRRLEYYASRKTNGELPTLAA